MRTTIVLNEDLLNQVKNLSGAKSKRPPWRGRSRSS